MEEIMEIPVSFFNHDAQAGGFYPKSHVGIDIAEFVQGNNLLLEGIRGTGKTHALKMVERYCLDNFHTKRVLPVYVSLAQISEHARKEPDEFRLHLYTHIVQRCIETAEIYKDALQPNQSLLQKAIQSISRLFNFKNDNDINFIINLIKETADNLRFELQFNLTSQSFKSNVGQSESVSTDTSIKLKAKTFSADGELSAADKQTATLSKQDEETLNYMGSKLAHKNGANFIIEFLKQIQILLNLDHSLILLDECSEADSEAQVEIFRLFKSIRGSGSLLQGKNSCAFFIGSVYPQGGTHYPTRTANGFNFEPGQDCTIEFLEWDETDINSYTLFFKDLILSRAKDVLNYKDDFDALVHNLFESYSTFLLAAYAANGIPRRFWEILKRGYDKNIKRITYTAVDIAVQEIANNQVLCHGYVTSEDFNFINNLIDRLLDKNVDIRMRNNKHPKNKIPQNIYFSVDRTLSRLLDRLIVQGVIHDKSRMRAKTRRIIRPMLALDMSLVYTFRVIPQKAFCNVITYDIPKSPRNGFDQAYEVKNTFLSEIYKSSTNNDDKELLKACNLDETVDLQNAEGTIKSYEPGKFGFIDVIDGGPNAFFYASQLEFNNRLTAKKGDKVVFSIKENDRGRQAYDLKIVESFALERDN